MSNTLQRTPITYDMVLVSDVCYSIIKMEFIQIMLHPTGKFFVRVAIRSIIL